jgi:hypothetical protein
MQQMLAFAFVVIATTLIAFGLMQPAIDFDDRRGEHYVAPKADPWDGQFVEEKAVLLSHGLVRLHEHNSTPLSRALGENDLIAAQGQPSAYERELDDIIRQYLARIGVLNCGGHNDGPACQNGHNGL